MWRASSIAAFVLALLTHESSVVFLPVLMLADWARDRRSEEPARESRRLDGRWMRAFAPYLALTVAYLVIDLTINSRNYVIEERSYTFGWHMASNTFNYLVALYVGRRDTLNAVFIVAGVAALLLRGSRRVVFATLWMLLALAPFVPFNWGNASRYLYQPAIGFSMLVAEAVVQLDRVLGERTSARLRVVFVTLVVTAVTVRFALFATGNIEGFAERTEAYRRYASTLKEVHGELPSHTIVRPDPRLEAQLPYRFVKALVQWEYRDPTIQLMPYE